MNDLIRNAETINKLLSRYGVKFGIYKNGEFREQLFPFDPIPRIIGNDEFSYLEKGLRQRVDALNCFLSDIYGKKQIVKDRVIPEEFIFSAKGFLVPCDGVTPPKGIYSHISGIDLVYPMIARELQRRSAPDAFTKNDVIDNRNYADLLKEVMDHVNTGGINVILSPGRYNAAFFEHSYLAEKTGAVLTTGKDIVCENDNLYYIDYNGKKQRVGAVYRRISDEYLDPMTFYEESVIGIPHIFEAYRKGNAALLNAPGNGVADDKGIYYFVPKMIKYYLGEEAILMNAPTYLPYYEKDMQYVLDNFDKLVIKDVAEAGGYGVVFGSSLTAEKKSEFIALLKAEPRRFIAQEVIDFYDLDILDENGTKVPRKADLRAFVLTGRTTKVWASGLTRFSRNPDSFIVNSSQGGGFKDTWVLSR